VAILETKTTMAPSVDNLLNCSFKFNEFFEDIAELTHFPFCFFFFINNNLFFSGYEADPVKFSLNKKKEKYLKEIRKNLKVKT